MSIVDGKHIRSQYLVQLVVCIFLYEFSVIRVTYILIKHQWGILLMSCIIFLTRSYLKSLVLFLQQAIFFNEDFSNLNTTSSTINNYLSSHFIFINE